MFSFVFFETVAYLVQEICMLCIIQFSLCLFPSVFSPFLLVSLSVLFSYFVFSFFHSIFFSFFLIVSLSRKLSFCFHSFTNCLSLKEAPFFLPFFLSFFLSFNLFIILWKVKVIHIFVFSRLSFSLELPLGSILPCHLLFLDKPPIES